MKPKVKHKAKYFMLNFYLHLLIYLADVSTGFNENDVPNFTQSMGMK